MSRQEDDGLTVPWWTSRWARAIAVLAAVVIVVLAGIGLKASQSPDPPEPTIAWHTGQPSTDPTATPTTSPEPSIASSTTLSATTPGAGPPAPQGGSGPKPVITAFSTRADGLIATVSFTFRAQADRGPFTCSLRRASIDEIDEFSCSVGQVSRTYDYDFCCGSEIYVIVTDRHGVRSDQWSGSVDFTRPDRPTYSNLEAWYDDLYGTVVVQFYVTAAPGDDPKCDVRVSPFPGTAAVEYSEYDQPCEGTYAVALPGPRGSYFVSISITSDSYWNPPPPDASPVVTV